MVQTDLKYNFWWESYAHLKICLVLDVDISDDVSLKAIFCGYQHVLLGQIFFRTDGILWLLEKEGVVGRAVAYSATCRALSRSYPFCCSVPNFTFGSEVIASLILSSTATVQARAAKLIRAGPIRCFRFWWIISDHAHPIQDGNGYPILETRVPDGFYTIRRRVWNEFSTRGYVIG